VCPTALRLAVVIFVFATLVVGVESHENRL